MSREKKIPIDEFGEGNCCPVCGSAKYTYITNSLCMFVKTLTDAKCSVIAKLENGHGKYQTEKRPVFIH